MVQCANWIITPIRILLKGFLKLSFILLDLGARVVQHQKAKLVKIVPELISEEPLITENTCVNIN